MIKNFKQYLNEVPNLPDSINDLDNFRKSKNKNLTDLIAIIKKDKNLYDELLKIMDFDFFDFSNKPRNIQNFIKITNLEFVISLSISILASKTIPTNLFAYAITNDEFLYSNVLSIRLLDLWIGKIDKNLRNELFLSTFLKNLSKPIISKYISENKLTQQFLSEIINSGILKAEEKFVGFTSFRVTANILKNWELSHNIIFPIAFCEDLINSPNSFRLKALIVNLINTICNPREPLKDINIEKVLKDLELFELDKDLFKKAINEIKSSILKTS